MRRQNKKNKKLKTNQTSFYFDDYLETNKKNKSFKKNIVLRDRIYLLFFLFFSLILIFSIKIINISLNKIEIHSKNYTQSSFSLLRRDIVDRNGTLISRNIKSFHAAVNPSLVKNKNNFLIKLRLNFPELPIKYIEQNLKNGKYFLFEKTYKPKRKREILEFRRKGSNF